MAKQRQIAGIAVTFLKALCLIETLIEFDLSDSSES